MLQKQMIRLNIKGCGKEKIGKHKKGQELKYQYQKGRV